MKSGRIRAGLVACLWFMFASSPPPRAESLPGGGTPRVLAAEDFKNAGLRGFNLDANVTLSDQDLRDMRRHGANVARFFVLAHRVAGTDTYALSPASLAAADRYVAFGASEGFRVVITLEPLPNNWKQEYWQNAGLRASIVQMWKELAARYKDNGAVAGYDLINEPIATADGSVGGAFSAEGSGMWVRFALDIIDAIRAIDPDHAVIFEPSPGGLPAAFGYLDAPLPRGNIVYSPHMYEPQQLTHQGIYHALSLTYPDPSDSPGAWGRAELAESLAPVRSFAARTGVPVFLGEFSIVRWAPENSAFEYLSDLLRIVNDEEKWSWSYHSWRECECWDAEIPSSFYHRFPYIDAKPVVPPDIQPRGHRDPPSDAIRLLNEYFAKD